MVSSTPAQKEVPRGGTSDSAADIATRTTATAPNKPAVLLACVGNWILEAWRFVEWNDAENG